MPLRNWWTIVNSGFIYCVSDPIHGRTYLLFPYNVFFSPILKRLDESWQLPNHHGWRLDSPEFQHLLDSGEHSHAKSFFGLPHGRLPGTSTSWIRLRGSFSLLRFTYPYRKSIFFFNTTSASSFLHLSKISLHTIVLSARDTPHMGFSIRLSHYCNVLVGLCVRGQVSAA